MLPQFLKSFPKSNKLPNLVTLVGNGLSAYFATAECGKIGKNLGGGCGSVGSVVTSKTRGPQFQNGHRQNFTLNILTGDN